MSAHNVKARIVTFGMFLLPLVLVKGTAVMLGRGPEAAIADPVGNTTTATTATIEPVVREWTPEQLAAARHIESLRSQPFGASPLLHQEPPPPQDDPRQHQTTPRIQPPPDVVVQIILKSSRGNIALIDRKRYRVGDSIGEGWVVKAIDADARSVLIEHTKTSEEATLVVSFPR